MDKADGGDPAEVPAPAALADYLGYLLRRVYERANRIARDVMPDGAHPRDLAILGVLAQRDAYSQRDLADRLHINRTIMVELIDRLEAAGWARRQRNPADRRTHIVAVTPAGRETMTRLAPAVRRGESAITAALRPAERRRLNELLHELVPVPDADLPADPVKRSALLLIHGHHEFRRRGDGTLARFGVRARDFAVLATLAEVQPCPQQVLARRLRVTEPAMVTIIDHLSDAGLVERRRNPADRRRYAMQLTDTGEETLRRAKAAMDELHAEVAATLGKAADADLRELLRKLL